MSNGFQGPPAVNFYAMLSGLGDTMQANAALNERNRIAAARSAAFRDFTALDPSSPGYGQQALELSHRLGAAGDSEGSQKFIQIATHAADQARAQHNADRSFSLAQSADRRGASAERRAQEEYDNTPDQYSKNPNFGKPGEPEFIDNYAQARMAAENAPGSEKFSTTPVYGTDNDPNSPTFGQPVVMQVGSRGNMIRSKPVDGVSMGGTTKDALKTMATRYLDTGDDTIIQRNRFGPGQLGQQTYDALQNEIEEQRQKRGMRPDEISSNKIDYLARGNAATAGARVAATREKNLELILHATEAAIPAALEANQNLPRTDYVPLNRLIQKGQVMTSDPRLVKFGMANLQLAEHWARAMNPLGVMRESDRDLALHYLDSAYGKGTYEQAVGQLHTQIIREKKAVAEGGANYDHKVINGGRPIKVQSPDEASLYPPGTKLILPDGSPGVVPGGPGAH